MVVFPISSGGPGWARKLVLDRSCSVPSSTDVPPDLLFPGCCYSATDPEREIQLTTQVIVSPPIFCRKVCLEMSTT